MVIRYPHRGEIRFRNLTTGSIDGITGADVTEKVYAITGRLEMNGRNNTDYSATFYAPFSKRLETLINEQAVITISGNTFNVGRVVNYETHLELWLK